MGRARQQLRQQHGGLRPSLLLSLEGSYGGARRGRVGCGAAGLSLAMSGQARADDLSTEPFGALCWVLRNPDAARPGQERRGVARRGAAGRGMARQQLRQQRWELRLPPLLSLRADMARQGPVRHGEAWRGAARHGMARPGTAWLGMVRPGEAGHGEARQGL